MSFPIRGQKVLSLVFKIIDARLTFGSPVILCTSRHSCKEIVASEIQRSIVSVRVGYVCVSLLSSYVKTSSVRSVGERATFCGTVVRRK